MVGKRLCSPRIRSRSTRFTRASRRISRSRRKASGSCLPSLVRSSRCGCTPRSTTTRTTGRTTTGGCRRGGDPSGTSGSSPTGTRSCRLKSARMRPYACSKSSNCVTSATLPKRTAGTRRRT
uniref:(northern house mosquito) hypothetical protein n=1 Tax=Culex pipiens TaxID=7175 RepID=A0A8D8D9H7_CULPI